MQLENVSDEFLEWLNQCPTEWFLIKQTKEDLTYCFTKDGENEDD